jgi:hypothetical protein
MFNVKEFWYKTFRKTLSDVKEYEKEDTVKDAIIVFANVEKEDEEKKDKILKKTVKNITWIARKTKRNRIVLHAFAHLSKSKSSTQFAETLFEAMDKSLRNRGYEVFITPFGYFLEFKLHVLGESLAKVWKQVN